MRHPRLLPGARGNTGASLGNDVSQYARASLGNQPLGSRTRARVLRHDEPLDEQGLRHLGDEVAPLVVEGIGRRAVAYWLDRASQASGVVATEAFRQADSIRHALGLNWGDLIDERRAA